MKWCVDFYVHEQISTTKDFCISESRDVTYSWHNKKNYTSAVQKVAKRGKTDFFKNSLKKLLHMEILWKRIVKLVIVWV